MLSGSRDAEVFADFEDEEVADLCVVWN